MAIASLACLHLVFLLLIAFLTSVKIVSLWHRSFKSCTRPSACDDSPRAHAAAQHQHFRVSTHHHHLLLTIESHAALLIQIIVEAASLYIWVQGACHLHAGILGAAWSPYRSSASLRTTFLLSCCIDRGKSCIPALDLVTRWQGQPQPQPVDMSSNRLVYFSLSSHQDISVLVSQRSMPFISATAHSAHMLLQQCCGRARNLAIRPSMARCDAAI